MREDQAGQSKNNVIDLKVPRPAGGELHFGIETWSSSDLDYGSYGEGRWKNFERKDMRKV
jgi:hypothetical protein